MAVTIKIPTPLRKYTSGQKKVEVAGATVEQALEALIAMHPDVKKGIYKDDGGLRADARIFIGPTDIRSTDGVSTAIEDGATLSIVPPVVGA